MVVIRPNLLAMIEDTEEIAHPIRLQAREARGERRPGRDRRRSRYRPERRRVLRR